MNNGNMKSLMQLNPQIDYKSERVSGRQQYEVTSSVQMELKVGLSKLNLSPLPQSDHLMLMSDCLWPWTTPGVEETW